MITTVITTGSNLHAAPGTDGLTSFFNHHCCDVVGPALTEVANEIHNGNCPTLSQRSTLMVFGSKNLKSTKLSDKNKNFSTKCGLQNCNRYFY